VEGIQVGEGESEDNEPRAAVNKFKFAPARCVGKINSWPAFDRTLAALPLHAGDAFAGERER